jgi:hypothetical protein
MPATNVPQTIHIWMFASAAASTVFVIPHAIIATMWHWPPISTNLHFAVTLGFWIAGVVFVTRKASSTPPRSNSSNLRRASPTPARRKQLSEIDELEALLSRIDEDC